MHKGILMPQRMCAKNLCKVNELEPVQNNLQIDLSIPAKKGSHRRPTPTQHLHAQKSIIIRCESSQE